MNLPLDVLDHVVSFGWPDAMLLIPAPNRVAVWARYCHYGRTTHVLVTMKYAKVTSVYIRLFTNGRIRNVFDETQVFSQPGGRKYTEVYNVDSARQRHIVDRLWYCVHDMCVWNAQNSKPRRSRMGNATRTAPDSYWKDVRLPHAYPAF